MFYGADVEAYLESDGNVSVRQRGKADERRSNGSTNYLSAGVTVGFVFMLLVALRKKQPT